MSDGWVEYKFSDIASTSKGKLPKNKNEDGLGAPYLTANFLRTNQPDYWIGNLDGAVTADDGDCLILWDGAGAGDLFSAKQGVVSSTMAVVKTTRTDISKEFLTLLISSKSNYIKETCRGTTVPHVSPDAINNMVLRVPPLSYQKRIVDLISALDSYVESLGTQAMKAMIARNAVLHEIITSGVVDWNSYKFKDVATATKGKLPRDKNEAGQGIPYLTANFLRTNKADFWIQNTDGAVMADDGDCLILWDGAGAGDLFSAQDGVVSSTMAVVKAKRPDITKEFLTLYISSKSSYIKETCRGTTVPHVSPDAINNMDVFIPSISEQNRIVDLISSMDESVDTLEVAHNAAKKLRAGLLFDLLTGNHAIPSSYDKVLGTAQ